VIEAHSRTGHYWPGWRARDEAFVPPTDLPRAPLPLPIVSMDLMADDRAGPVDARSQSQIVQRQRRGPAPGSVFRCHRCGKPKRGHTCETLTFGDPAPSPLPTQPLSRPPLKRVRVASSHALGIINANNAQHYPPPSLKDFLTDASRLPVDCAPALWFRQMTGTAWQRDSHSFDVAKKRYWRLLDENKAAERERDKKRNRSKRQRSVDTNGATRKKERRAEVAAEEARKHPVVCCTFTIAHSSGGAVRLGVRPSEATRPAGEQRKIGRKTYCSEGENSFQWKTEWSELEGCAHPSATCDQPTYEH
jgi:hypothetical protein